MLAPIVDRLAPGAGVRPSCVYHTPVERAVFDDHPAFALAADLGFGLIYRLRPALRKEVPVARRILGDE